MKNFLSIIIPLYNKEKSIGRAIESVLSQHYSNYELIIVNDGSTDASLSVVKKFNDERIKIFNIKNSGVAYARNYGISKSVSPFVCLLDADDAWDSNFLNEISLLIENDSNASLYCCRYKLVNEIGEVHLGNLSLPSDFFGRIDNFYKTYSSSRSLICSSCVCINKMHLNKIGGFPTGVRTGEDIYTWLTLNLEGHTSFSAKVLATVYRNTENRTNTRVKREIPYHLKIYLNKNFANKKLESFCLKNATLYAMEAKMNDDIVLFEKYLEMIKEVSIIYYLLLRFFGRVPSAYILNLKKLRDRVTLK